MRRALPAASRPAAICAGCAKPRGESLPVVDKTRPGPRQRVRNLIGHNCCCDDFPQEEEHVSTMVLLLAGLGMMLFIVLHGSRK
jgi:hypothetical protein